MAYTKLYKHLLTKLEPERAHNWAMAGLTWIGRLGLAGMVARYYCARDPRLRVETLGLRFPNPIGLAGGFDKDARAIPSLSALGFGFIEAGAVTPVGQPGNPKPRIHRFPDHEALINSMGFPNDGATAVRDRLARLKRRSVPVGVGFGKNKETSLDRAVEDYTKSLEAVRDVADFFVINVSSPNTPGLRQLLHGEFLDQILPALMETRSAGESEPKPLLLKMSPDVDDVQLEGILRAGLAHGIDGLIATNTTLSRDGLGAAGEGAPAGGLSGAPLRERSTEIVRKIHQRTEGKVPIVGVGGVFTARDALEKIAAGASLIQVYTGFIYRGPGFARDLNKGILKFLEQNGLQSVGDLVGDEAALEQIQAEASVASPN